MTLDLTDSVRAIVNDELQKVFQLLAGVSPNGSNSDIPFEDFLTDIVFGINKQGGLNIMFNVTPETIPLFAKLVMSLSTGRLLKEITMALEQNMTKEEFMAFNQASHKFLKEECADSSISKEVYTVLDNDEACVGPLDVFSGPASMDDEDHD